MKRGWKYLKEQLRRPLIAGVAGVIILLIIGAGAYATIGGSSLFAPNPVNLQKGLVGWWKMDGNAKDATPYGNNGTVNGAVLTTDWKGRANSAYSFAGAQSISVSDSAALRLNGSFSLSFWYKDGGSVTTYPGILVKGGGASSGNGWNLYYYNGSLCYKRDNLQVCTAGGVVTSTTKYFTITYDGTNVRLYVNGANTNTAPKTYATNTSSVAMQMGLGDPGQFAIGTLDDVRIYNRTISASEVTALYGQYDPAVKAAAGEKGLVGWWKMHGNAKDDTPLANNATVTAATLTTDREGKANSAYALDGSSAYLTAGNPSDLSLMPSTFSWSAWVYTSNVAKDQMFLSKQGANYFRILGGKLFASLYIGGVQKTKAASTSLSNNTWYHVAVTYDGSAMTIYLNGNQDGQLTGLSGIVNFATGSFNIGRWISADPRYLQGRISDVRLYNRALSQQELAGLYNSYNSQISVSSLQQGLVGDWPLNGNAKDATPYAINGTVSGATLDIDRKSRANSAYSFNGISNSIRSNNAPGLTVAGTVSAWAKVNSWGSSYDSIVFKGPGVGWASIDYCLIRNGAGNQFVGSISDGTNTLASGGPRSSVISLGQWYYLVFTWDGTTAYFYTNGVQTGSVPWAHVAANRAGTLGLGIANNYSSYPFNGSIDDVRMWNRAVSQSEVTALYQGYR